MSDETKKTETTPAKTGRPFVTTVQDKDLPIVDDVVKSPVNPMAQPQPIKSLSEAQRATQEELKNSANANALTRDGRPVDTGVTTQDGRPIQTGPRVRVPGLTDAEVRVEVAPGMEHMADGKEQIAYATVTVSDKTVTRGVNTVEPMGSRRLADEQAAGRASLERKHGVNQLENERTTGRNAAERKG